MRGQILDYNPLEARGCISGDDGDRYEFSGSDWRGDASALRAGAMVDFTVEDSRACEIYRLPTQASALSSITAEEKSPLVAGLLALLLGGVGIHKFYLGYNTQGIILLIGSVISYLLLIVLIGFLGFFIIGIVCVAEAVIYMTMNPEDFRKTYVQNKKPWF